MGTEVLRPQDCLVNRLPAFHRRRSYLVNGNGGFGTNPKPNNYRKPINNRPERLDRRKKPHLKELQQPQPNLSIFSSRSPRTPSPRAKRTPSADELLQSHNHLNKSAIHPNHHVEMGRVTILRRGQSLDSFERKINKDNGNKRGGTPMNNRICAKFGEDVYAGSAFSMSPSPSSLPLPSFFINDNNRKCESENDDLATRDLRRLLGLE